ncbi:hypothetical protein AX760_21665 [Pararhizobium antarcticum]|uniref:Uncharacterized protein n=1 Tax=Pararhizobium antarcticum TaxID=1798805 RepID=A0A657LQ41_9HYPH|nr:hypothetical protein AX760_21665 [Pararhizobium antarcticum]OJF93553.1 hypothetical protein AX761_20095 [Rhizobium sp. 58]
MISQMQKSNVDRSDSTVWGDPLYNHKKALDIETVSLQILKLHVVANGMSVRNKMYIKASGNDA